MGTIKYIELFAGIGGFRNGLEQVGGFNCGYANEYDRFANSVYRKHYGECDIRDIRDVDFATLPDCDMVVGGFPCQPFSIAGKRKGFIDKRGDLFFEVIRFIKCKRPSIVLLENVKGLLNIEKGQVFTSILRAFQELDYNVQCELLNTQNFGIPQHRERVFIIATPREKSFPQIFPIGEIGNVSETENGNQREGKERICSTIDSRYGALRGCGETYIASAVAVPLKFLTRNQKNYQGEYSFTVDASNTGGIMKDSKIRRLTPIECERLQNFPNNWTKYGHDGQKMSDTQRYKMCGNAVSTNVIRVIGERIKEKNK